MAPRRSRGFWGPTLVLVRYWGYVALAVLLLMVGGGVVTSVVPYYLLSGLVLVYALIGAPVVCGALNRTKSGTEPTYCRNNASGLLLGCNQVRSHKWQKLQAVWWTSHLTRSGWRQLWSGPAAVLATVSGALSIGAAGYATIRLVLGQF